MGGAAQRRVPSPRAFEPPHGGTSPTPPCPKPPAVGLSWDPPTQGLLRGSPPAPCRAPPSQPLTGGFSHLSSCSRRVSRFGFVRFLIFRLFFFVSGTRTGCRCRAIRIGAARCAAAVSLSSRSSLLPHAGRWRSFGLAARAKPRPYLPCGSRAGRAGWGGRPPAPGQGEERGLSGFLVFLFNVLIRVTRCFAHRYEQLPLCHASAVPIVPPRLTGVPQGWRG